jgi:hypothetical protein
MPQRRGSLFNTFCRAHPIQFCNFRRPYLFPATITNANAASGIDAPMR